VLKIRLARVGKKNQQQFRFVVTNHVRPVKTNFIEILGAYHPKEKNKIQSLKLGRIKYWLKQGAHLSDRAIVILKPHLVNGSKIIADQTKKLEKKITHRKEVLAKQNLKSIERKRGVVKKEEAKKSETLKKKKQINQR
jgi:ribosomal protein S16